MPSTKSLLLLPLLLATPTFAQIASVQWYDLNHIRLYMQDDDGRINESQWDGNGWTGPSWIGAVAKKGTAMSAVNAADRVSGFAFFLSFRSC